MCAADETERAIACCERALGYHANDASVAALLAELRSRHCLCDAAALKERAASRFRAGGFASAEAVYALLATWQESTCEERAAAHSNRALCLMKLEQHDAAVAACSAALQTLALSAVRPAHDQTVKPGVDAGGRGAGDWDPQAECAGTCTGDVNLSRNAGLQDAVAILQRLADDKSGVASVRLAVKVLARSATCCAHIRKSSIALRQYEAAASLADALHDVGAANAFRADARHMNELGSQCGAVLRGSDSGKGRACALADKQSDLSPHGQTDVEAA